MAVEDDSGNMAPRPLPGGPREGEPVPLDPVAGIDLDRMARVSARLDEKREPMRAALRAEGVDEVAWIEAQRVWYVRIAAALMRGDTTLATAYDAAYTSAQDGLGAEDAAVPLETLAALHAAIAAGGDGARLIAAAGLTLARFARAERRLALERSRDPALDQRFRELVATAGRPGPT